MSAFATVNEDRSAHIWLQDGQHLTIGECDWPDGFEGLDTTEMAERWSNLTGLDVTVEATIKATARVRS